VSGYSHLTRLSQDDSLVIGYSHSTRLPKYSSQVSGYLPEGEETYEYVFVLEKLTPH